MLGDIDTNTFQVTLRGLKNYTNYSIWVSASTVKGNGNASKPIIVSTGEDSKFPYGTTILYEVNSTESFNYENVQGGTSFYDLYNMNANCNVEIFRNIIDLMAIKVNL